MCSCLRLTCISCLFRIAFCSSCSPAFTQAFASAGCLAGLALYWPCCCMQVHLFIFFMAITHILGGILLIVLAALRIRFWKRWTEHSDHAALE